MRLLGLTGGIASGKSTFARLLRDRGLPVVEADVLARRVVEPGTPALAAIVEAFGPGVLDPGGALDRRRLGARVFADPVARRELERITHPAIRREMAEEVLRLAATKHPLAFYDAPLLYEVGLDTALDAVVVVYAPPEVQRVRLVLRDAISEAEADARLVAQLPIDDKARRADFVVDNAGPPDALGEKADRLLADLRAGRGRRLPNAAPLRY